MFSVIFDMDGTLLDTQRIVVPAWETAGRNQGFKNMGEESKKVFGTNENGSNAFLKENYPTLNIPRFRADARKYIQENLIIEYKTGAPALLEFLKENNIKIGLASGTSRRSVEHHLKEVNALDYFDAVVCGTEVENGKPAPDVFLLTSQKMGVKPEDCFVFEDSKNGIIAAHSAGMKCIGIADVVPFDYETKKLMCAEFFDFYEAIEMFKELMR